MLQKILPRHPYFLDIKLSTSISLNLNAEIEYTVKLVYNDHPRDPKFVAVVVRWSLFRGRFIS